MTKIRDVMTTDIAALDVGATLEEAARLMADRDIGDVVVTDGGEVCGIVTDRDIVVRAIAHGMTPLGTALGEICSRDLTTLGPDDEVDTAVQGMRERALRRIPITDGPRPVGIVSIGDLALELDRTSALADISAAPANA